jgi:hypothetical protein
VPAVRAQVDTGADSGAVLLDWPAPPTAAGEIDYQVVRSGSGETAEVVVTAERTARDERPPINVPLTYAVVARRGAAAAAPAVAGPLVVRPEPADVELFAGDGVVAGRWRCPPEAARTLVTRGDTPVAANKESFRDDDVRNGITYHYRFAAVYVGEDGAEVTTRGVWRSATPAAPPEPIADLAVLPDPADPGRVLATFAAPPNGTAEIVVLGGAPPWPYGAVVPVSEVLRSGRRVTAVPVSVPASGEGLRFQAPTGVLLAITVAGDTAAIGAHRPHVNLPPPQGLVAERRGGSIIVGFDWPPGMGEVEVTHRVVADAVPGNGASVSPKASGGVGGRPPSGGADEARRAAVTRAAYDAQGGVRLAAPENATVEIAVCSAGLAGGARVTGAPVTTTVPGRCVVRYDLYRTGPPWRRALVVKLTPDGAMGGAVRLRRLVLVRRAGKVMPQRPADGETIAAWDDIELSGPTDLTVPPAQPSAGAGGPYWLRCFLDGEAELADPPIRTLRFS